MEFYSYNGERYTSGPHYYNRFILNNLGVPNSVILINGHNFSEDFKQSSVLFNNVSASAIQGDSTTIYVAIPDQVPPGPVRLTINTNGKSIVHPTQFTVEAPDPHITGLNTPAGMRGSQLVIYGENFSTTAAKTNVTINGTAAVIDSVKLDAVYFKVPVNATSGKIVLTTFGKALSYPDDFTVTSSTFTTISNIGLRFLSLDDAGNFYGTIKNAIYKVTPGGISSIVTKLSGVDYNLISGAYFGGCTADKAGTVYFIAPFVLHDNYPNYNTDYLSRVIKVLPDGSLSEIAGGGYPAFTNGQGKTANFNSPYNLILDALTGNFYVNDTFVIRKVTPSGLVSTIANALPSYGPITLPGFTSVSGIAIHPETGDLYLVSLSSNTIGKITPGGTISTMPITGDKISTGGQQNAVINLAITASGTLYLSVGSNLYQIKNGVATNTYGNPAGGNIWGMTLDKAGNLYLSATELFNRYNYNPKNWLYKVIL
ncbi:IPT/TIG domain-containing protein [Mucilaginibacter sp. CSA2-8R]|uniref:IPT/TIG domain-containing protein n=1 Tax=Mucilaginibacter sp. CSA2-8R TaxID=3141542 RepID=UPI00315C88CA